MKRDKIIKGIIASALVALTGSVSYLPVSAQNAVIKNPVLEHRGTEMTASLTLDLGEAQVRSNGIAVFTPMLVNEKDTLKMPSVGVYGRIRWIQYERRDGKPYHDENADVAMKYSKDMAEYTYSETFPYQDWMNGSELMVMRSDYGCAGCGKSEEEYPGLASYRHVDYKPVFFFEEVAGNVEKTSELSGKAYIEFKVNRTDILPDYRNNHAELSKIIATIDSVRNDKDITVTSISIHGAASPEGSYALNERLAKGRTEALKNYVDGLYNFPEGFIKTSYEAENWTGLRKYIESSDIDNKEAILAIINLDIDPDTRNNRIQKEYPVQYQFLLKNVYPSLRSSDYKIEYTIRSFTEVSEIEEALRTAPQKLNLNELYFLASHYESGSDAYNNVFETAAAMFPEDETANLNAAVAEMQGGNIAEAQKYLYKAGNSPKAVYARGVYEAMNGNFDKAIHLVEEAISLGFEDNAGILDHLREAAKYSD